MSILSRLFTNENQVPQPLPTGMTAFDEWSSRIIGKAGPLADEDSMRFVLASQIMHLPPSSADVPDEYFINGLRKAAASQVASQVFQDIKAKQAAKPSNPTSEDTLAAASVPSDAQKAQ